MHFFCIILFVFFQLMLVKAYVSKCVKPGVKCADCQHLIHCVGTPENTFKSYELNFCNNSLNEYCSVEGGGCVNDAKACKIFGLNELICQNSGTFPDPYDCNAYHLCIRQENGEYTSVRNNCPDDRAYNALTGTCSSKPNHRVCTESPVPKCEKSLQSGALQENESIYYVCVNISNDLIPLEYKCRPGEIYYPLNHECMESKNAPFSCPKEGKFPDSRNCYKYFHCNKYLTFTHETCRPGSYFNEIENVCVKGQCEKVNVH